MPQDLFLVMNDTFLGSYMAAYWFENFIEHPNFRGVLLRGDKPSEEIIKQRRLFHQEFAGQKTWNEEQKNALVELYGRFNGMEQLMVRMYGFPTFSNVHDERAIFIGKDINSEETKAWLQGTCQSQKAYFFLYVSQIAKPWWIEISGGRVLNCHSAVLPHARGLYSIENVAATRDTEAFLQAAGITVHFIDAGVDTGPLIRTERIIDPLRFDSIWELKAHIYQTGCRVYAQVAKELLIENGSIPAGIVTDPSQKGPNYLKKHFTPEKRKEAEEGFLTMKSKVARLSE